MGDTREACAIYEHSDIFPLFLFQTLSPLGWWFLFYPSTAPWTQSSTRWPPDLSRKWSISSGTITDKEGLWIERRLQRHLLPHSSGWRCGPCKRCPLNSWSQRFSQTPAICHWFLSHLDSILIHSWFGEPSLLREYCEVHLEGLADMKSMPQNV